MCSSFSLAITRRTCIIIFFVTNFFLFCYNTFFIKSSFLFWNQAINLNDYVHVGPNIKIKSMRCKFESIFHQVNIYISWPKNQNMSFKCYNTILDVFVGVWKWVLVEILKKKAIPKFWLFIKNEWIRWILW